MGKVRAGGRIGRRSEVAMMIKSRVGARDFSVAAKKKLVDAIAAEAFGNERVDLDINVFDISLLKTIGAFQEIRSCCEEIALFNDRLAKIKADAEAKVNKIWADVEEAENTYAGKLEAYGGEFAEIARRYEALAGCFAEAEDGPSSLRSFADFRRLNIQRFDTRRNDYQAVWDGLMIGGTLDEKKLQELLELDMDALTGTELSVLLGVYAHMFKSEAENASMAALRGYFEKGGMTNQTDAFWDTYAKLMPPGGKPDFGHLRTLMATPDPDTLEPGQLEAIHAVYSCFMRVFAEAPEGSAAHMQAEIDIDNFVKASYMPGNLLGKAGPLQSILSSTFVSTGMPSSEASLFSPIFEKMMGWTAEYAQSKRFLHAIPKGLEYAAWLTAMNCLAAGKPFGNFVPDVEQGIFYVSKGNRWQSPLGYDYLYDMFFFVGTQGHIEAQNHDFIVTLNGIPTRVSFWSWKGDYLCLGAGAETGFYFGFPGLSAIPGLGKVAHKTAGKYLPDGMGTFPMTLELRTKEGEVIFKREAGEDDWPTGFDPSYQNPDLDDLVAITTIRFDTKNTNDRAIYEAFEAEYGEGSSKDRRGCEFEFIEDGDERIVKITM